MTDSEIEKFAEVATTSWQLYIAFVREGFTPDQAIRLLQSFIAANTGNSAKNA